MGSFMILRFHKHCSDDQRKDDEMDRSSGMCVEEEKCI